MVCRFLRDRPYVNPWCFNWNHTYKDHVLYTEMYIWPRMNISLKFYFSGALMITERIPARLSIQPNLFLSGKLMKNSCLLLSCITNGYKHNIWIHCIVNEVQKSFFKGFLPWRELMWAPARSLLWIARRAGENNTLLPAQCAAIKLKCRSDLPKG